MRRYNVCARVGWARVDSPPVRGTAPSAKLRDGGTLLADGRRTSLRMVDVSLLRRMHSEAQLPST